MGLSQYRCVICGKHIRQQSSTSWLSEFRAIYEDSSGEHVTGVGYKDDSDEWSAPFDPALNWGLEGGFHDEAFVHHVKKDLDSRRDFFLHNACWNMLHIFIPEELSLRRLCEVLKSVPTLHLEGGLSWDHNYSGGLVYDAKAHYPWEEYLPYVPDPILLSTTECPCKVLDIESLAPRVSAYPLCRSLLPPERQDCFSRLPTEIIEMVASLLSTRDALRLHLVSKAIPCLLSKPSFWASRFWAYGERGFVFEARQAAGIDWLSLYRHTSDRLLPASLKCRKRIWSLITLLSELLRLSLTSNLTYRCLKPVNHEWSEVRGDVRCNSAPRTDFTNGSQSLGQHIIPVPHELSTIAFSKIDIGPVSFITGLHLRDLRGVSIKAGYLGGTQTIECGVRLLKGFILAIGGRGIHALRILDENKDPSDWVGDPGDSPRTERLAIADAIEAIKVEFDGYKLVGLSVSAKNHGRFAPIRQAALWYPTVPPSHLSLNDSSFTGEDPLQTGYQPLCWIHFGGTGGQYLKNIVGMSFLYAGGCIHSLCFHYESSSTISSPCLGRFDLAQNSELPFWAIDGAAGERIEAIEAGLRSYRDPNAYRFLQHGTLNYIKLTTNRRRTLNVGDPASATCHLTFSIEPNTTITGFYASKHHEFGLISLGAVSEHVELN